MDHERTAWWRAAINHVAAVDGFPVPGDETMPRVRFQVFVSLCECLTLPVRGFWAVLEAAETGPEKRMLANGNPSTAAEEESISVAFP